MKARDLIEEIAAASKEQSAGISQINMAMGQVSEAAYNGSQQMDKMAIMADDLTKLSTKLQNETARFKLKNSAGDITSVMPNIKNPSDNLSLDINSKQIGYEDF